MVDALPASWPRLRDNAAGTSLVAAGWAWLNLARLLAEDETACRSATMQARKRLWLARVFGVFGGDGGGVVPGMPAGAVSALLTQVLVCQAKVCSLLCGTGHPFVAAVAAWWAARQQD